MNEYETENNWDNYERVKEEGSDDTSQVMIEDRENEELDDSYQNN